ncbi:MAG: hypothetical protein JXB34_10165 [Bacteroidales bacterium]|nr:hypothetical protein [Bacteroidales bacterium]
MKLIANCNYCKGPIKVSAFMIENRIELARKKGKEFELRCEKCGRKNDVHVDDVQAVDGLWVKIVGLFSILAAVLLTIFFWGFGFIALASFTIPILIVTTVNQNQRTKIKQFNLMYYDSKRPRK